MSKTCITCVLGMALLVPSGMAIAAGDVTEITLQVIEENSAAAITQQIQLPALQQMRERQHERERTNQDIVDQALRDERQEMHEQRLESQQQGNAHLNNYKLMR